MRVLAFFLLGGGVALEIVGLVATFREVRRRLGAVVDYERRSVTVYGHAAMAVAAAGRATVTTDPPPTLEQEVESLKLAVAQLHNEIATATKAAEARSRDEAAQITDAVRRQGDDHLAALATLAVSSVGRGWRAYLGPGLFLAGLLMQSASNLVQLVALAP